MAINEIVGASKDFARLKGTSYRHCFCHKMGLNLEQDLSASGTKAEVALGWRLCKLCFKSNAVCNIADSFVSISSFELLA